MPLTDLAIRNAKPGDKPYKLADGGGLFLLVNPAGSKLWRLKYRVDGREKLLALGTYPLTTLADARQKRDGAKKHLENGTDPSVQKRQAKLAASAAAANTFGLIAAEYIGQLQEKQSAAITVAKNRWLIENLASPLAKRPIAEITAADILDLLKRIEKSGRKETARRLRGVIGSVFRLAVVTLRAPADPTPALRGALLPPNVQHRAAITDEKQLGALMKSIDEYHGWQTLTAALKLLALTMTRPGDIRGMRRSEINFKTAMWRIPAARMKMRRPHDVPLSLQALQVLREAWPLSEHSELVFPSIVSTKKLLSENAMNAALRRMGYAKEEMTAHGFRSAASTILNDRGFRPDVIEAALAHQDTNAIRSIYNRGSYFDERVTLMQKWADLLDEFRAL
jgi:integrase